MKDLSTNIRVVVRVRPKSVRELELNQKAIIKVENSGTLIFDPDEEEDEFFFHGAKQNHRDITRKVNKKLVMHFDQIFDADSINDHIFESCMKPLVVSVMDGFNCSAFVYGATGAGKTHTMLGNDEQPGITYLTMEYLFDQINELSAERKFDIGISYLEVYNEQVMNLLTKTGPLKLREDTAGVVVGGLSLKKIDSADELLTLLAVGNKNRTQHPTDANAESSRSHAIFQVHIRMINKATGQKNTVKLSMIDLAGSERAASTKGMGLRFKEGASINKSLLALGNCINKLADGAKHIPYRDSNLTRIIKDSLGGNCQTVMIANVSPSSLTYEDTYNTLKYASRAKKIRTDVKVNICRINVPKEVLVQQLADQSGEVARLKEHIKFLESRLASKEQQQKKISATLPSVTDDESAASVAPWSERVNAIYEALKTSVEQYYKLASNEKVLRFRKQIKEHAEDTMKILILDGSDLKRDLEKLEASVDRFGKQMECHKQDMARSKKRIDEKYAELQMLRKNMAETDGIVSLNTYIDGKETELEAIKAKIKTVHVLNINSIYHNEFQHLMKVQRLSNEIIQYDYYLMRANHLIDSTMQEKYEQLKKLNQGKRDVKFTDDSGDRGDMIDSAVLKFSISMDKAAVATAFVEPRAVGQKRNRVDPIAAKKSNKKLFKDETASTPLINNSSRTNFGSSSSSNVRFVQPFKIDSVTRNQTQGVMGPPQIPAITLTPHTNFNETHIISTDDALPMDTDDTVTVPLPTFKIQTTEKNSVFHLNERNSQIQSKSTLLKNILRENNSDALYNKVGKLIRSKPTLPVKSGTVNKENKRYSPIRSRKSPKMRTPRNNIASKVRQRMLSANANLNSDDNNSGRQRFKSVPPK